MSTKTFTVDFVNDPKEGKKKGNIKCSDGAYLGLWPSDKHLFEKGKTYTAIVDEHEWQGKTYYTIKSPGKGGAVKEEGASPAAPQAPSGASSSKDDTITRIAIAKSCIEAHEDMSAADRWYAWVMRQNVPETQATKSDDLDDEIPF